MSEPAVSQPFLCFLLNTDGSKGDIVGGAYTEATAVSVACAAYLRWRQAVIVTKVADDSQLAHIGKTNEPAV